MGLNDSELCKVLLHFAGAKGVLLVFGKPGSGLHSLIRTNQTDTIHLDFSGMMDVEMLVRVMRGNPDATIVLEMGYGLTESRMGAIRAYALIRLIDGVNNRRVECNDGQPTIDFNGNLVITAYGGIGNVRPTLINRCSVVHYKSKEAA